jgi:hypothetical protein
MKTTYTFDDLTKEAQHNVLNSRAAAANIGDAIRSILQSNVPCYHHEREAMEAGQRAAASVADRAAARALESLMIRTKP